MSRRRLTLRAYVRRRWRMIGAFVVVLLGALLVLAVADRGHDPLWQARAGVIESAAPAPDASAVYALVREEGSIARIVALSGRDGALLWEGPVNATRAVMAAGPSGVAVATDFPRAFLTVYGADSSIRWQVPLEGNPVAIAIEGDHLALALNAPGNPVLLYEGDRLVRTFPHASPVRALDLEQDVLATGGLQGEVVARRLDGSELANLTLPMSPRSIRLAHDGTALIVGGYGLTPADARGLVAFLDPGHETLVRWRQETPVGVGIVDTDGAALLALAIEESPPSATLHLYDGATGATLWTREMPGTLARDDAGMTGGAALSPDASRIAVGTQSGALLLLDARTGDELWSYRAAGASFVTFADDDPLRLVAGGRLVANRPFDSLMMFSSSAEPLTQHAGALAIGFVSVAGIALALLLGIGFRRARGPY